jgi:hypothetical protein
MDMPADTIDEAVAATSVRDLVRAQLGVDDDPWELALVQRDLVWKQDRMVGLLDSLLAGYPIGSLLLCRVEQETDVRQLGTGQGQERRVAAGTPQLVDGQQRVYALFSIFTGRGHGRFYLSLTKDWDRSLNYIEWRPRVDETDADDEPRADDEEPIPPGYVDLSRWADDGDDVCDTPSETTLAKFVAKLTNGLALPSETDARTAILRRLLRLCQAWREKRIPVITSTVEGPEDILEVFTRVNRGGAQASGNDLYFAAVKTFWHDTSVNEDSSITAKGALSKVVTASRRFLDTWGALSLVSRLALVGLRESDMVPLKIDRLSRANKVHIIRALRVVAPIVAQRIELFTDVLRKNSKLKQGLRYVHRLLWEDVFAWVVASNRSDSEKWSAEDVPPVETYLLGASLFSYPQVLGDPYRRDAFAVALAAGADHEAFPTSRLLAVARNRGEDLRRGRGVVLPSTALVEIAKRNTTLVIAVAQGLDDEVKGLDWDHILAADWKGRKFRLPRGSGRRYREEAAHFNDPGNLWQIDLEANRSLHEAFPAKKFATLEAWPADGWGRVAPSRYSGIKQPEHLEEFKTIGDLLEADKVEEAASRFAALVQTRNKWLAERLVKWPSSPPITLFASDSAVAPEDVPRIPETVSLVLGVDGIRTALAESRAKLRAQVDKAKADVEVLLGMTPPWAGQAGKLDWVLREVTKRHARISREGLGWWVERDPERQTLARSVPLLPLESRDHFRLIVTGLGTGDGRSPFRVRVKADSPGFATIRKRLVDDGEFELADVDGGMEISIQTRPELDWGEMLAEVDRQVTRFRAVAEADDEVPGAPVPANL